MRDNQISDRQRIEKLEAHDAIFLTSFSSYQWETVSSLTRLETQMGILLQERRPLVPQAPNPPR
jgi:hypothetical protein